MTDEHIRNAVRAPRSPFEFIRSRWSGSVSAGRIFWNDMIVHGTTINILAAALGLALIAYDAPTALGMTIFFAPMPYNLFVFAALFKKAAGLEPPWVGATRAAGFVWLVLVTIV